MPLRPIERFAPEVKEQPWGTETVIARLPDGTTMKRLHYRAGFAGGLQYHKIKRECFYVEFGMAVITYDRGDGTLVDVPSFGGDPAGAFVIPPGAPHQFRALTDCIVFEISTQGANDRVNVAGRYGRASDPNDLPTTYSAEEIAAFEAAL